VSKVNCRITTCVL